MYFVSYHLRPLPALRHNVQSTTNYPEAAGVVEHSISEAAGEHTASSEKLVLNLLKPSIEIAQSRAIQSSAVQWIIETSTDIAARMVPEIE